MCKNRRSSNEVNYLVSRVTADIAAGITVTEALCRHKLAPNTYYNHLRRNRESQVTQAECPSYHRPMYIRTPNRLYQDNPRYRILKSSMATLMYLRDNTDDLDLQLALTTSINKVSAEIRTLTAT